jgi:hypothetical protein
LLPKKTEGTIPEKVFVDIIRKPEGFSTGKKTNYRKIYANRLNS